MELTSCGGWPLVGQRLSAYQQHGTGCNGGQPHEGPQQWVVAAEQVVRRARADRGQGRGADDEGGKRPGDAGVPFSAVEARHVGGADQGRGSLGRAEEADEGKDPKRARHEQEHQQRDRLDTQGYRGGDPEGHAITDQAEQDAPEHLHGADEAGRGGRQGRLVLAILKVGHEVDVHRDAGHRAERERHRKPAEGRIPQRHRNRHGRPARG